MTGREWFSRSLASSLAVAVLALGVTTAPPVAAAGRESGAASPREPACGPVPVPSIDEPLADEERKLFNWILQRCYRQQPGWKKDKRVRDTGPFLQGASYDLHPAPRIYYSPEVVEWLENGRKREPERRRKRGRGKEPRHELERGAAIIKEMFEAPAARYSREAFERARAEPGYDGPDNWQDWVDALPIDKGWAIMVKTGDTWDGWFWGSLWEAPVDELLASNDFPFPFRFSAFGEPTCLRCHAVAEKESTFSALRNVEGGPGEPARFRVDNSWRDDLSQWQKPARGRTEADLLAAVFHGAPAPVLQPGLSDSTDHPEPTPGFGDYFRIDTTHPVEVADFSLPSQWADSVPAGPDGAEQFLTSDNCYGCHGGLGGPPYAISMFVKTGPKYGDGFNISPFGEWRWSPMGLAGRDPIFHAQLEMEVATLRTYDRKRLAEEGVGDPDRIVEELVDALQNTCLSCHGAMGQRQLLIDHQNDRELDPNMKPEYFYLHGALTAEDRERMGEAYRYHKYGNLGREGISCAVCHHIDPPEEHPEYDELQNFLMNSTTGVFPYSPPDVLNGPFEDVQVKPMQQALDITPEYNPYIKDSKMCGTCHTINLPNVDAEKHEFPFLDQAARNGADFIEKRWGVDYAQKLARFPHSIEQATYLEWENSSFSQPGSFAKRCQDCHMPRSFHAETDSGPIHIDPIVSQIATIQDSTYPEVDHDLPDSEIDIPLRNDYRRHEMVGLNAFLLEMTRQFDDVLGLSPQADYMTGATTGNAFAVENIQRQAREESVELTVDRLSVDDGFLTADVTLRNLVGHRFTSGVSFRRAWIELEVGDGSRTVFHSGHANHLGLITDLDGEVLPSEFLTGAAGGRCFERQADGECRLVDPTCYQPHFDGTVPETRPITDSSQVQIYEELVLNGACEFTTSFIHRDTHVKDNRLLPRGWREAKHFADELVREFMEATDPQGTGDDPDFKSRPGEIFPGTDTVRYRIELPEGVDPADLTIDVKVYFQALTPFWLQEKFSLAPNGSATQRLYYIASRLQTGPGSPIEGWKLPLASFSGPVVVRD